MTRTLLLAALLAGPAPTAPAPAPESEPKTPIVIAHRGASGYRPEHTLAAYELAIDMGADFIEPDVVITKDGVLVARHENRLDDTTDVAERPEFADRRATRTYRGRESSGWFAEDFTLEELKTLRCKERLPELRPGSARYDGRFTIPTLEEVIALARAKEEETGRRIGLYIETKRPSYFDSIGLSLEEPLVETLKRAGYEGPDAPVFIQSFESDNLKDLSTMTDLPRVQLITLPEQATPEALAEIAKYARGVGPVKGLVIPREPDGTLGEPTSLVADAHAAGLLVHPWTFRSENAFLPAEFRTGDPSDPAAARARGDAAAEYRLFHELGIDGLFSDHPDDAVAARP